MSLITLIEFWMKITLFIISISCYLNKEVDPEPAAALYQGSTRALLSDPLKWFHSTSEWFIRLFDMVYSGSKTFLYDSLWYAILFCYPAFLLSRAVLRFFAIPTPSTELMLITTLVTTVSVVILRAVVVRTMHILGQVSGADGAQFLRKHWSEGIKILLLVMLFMYIAITVPILVISGIGITFHNIFVLSFGGSLAVPIAFGVALIPSKPLVVSPLRAFLSSMAFLLLIGLLVPSASLSFFADLDFESIAGVPLQDIPDFLLSIIPEGRAPVLGTFAFIIYNLFADAISLIETRFLLKLSIGARIGKLVGLLILDLFLSAAIYLLLPLIAGQDLQVLGSAIFFSGDKPWMGILFWSTFATSLVFYLFIASNIIIVLVTPLLRFVKWFDSIIKFSKRPFLAIGISMSLTLLVIFLLVFIVNRLISLFLG